MKNFLETSLYVIRNNQPKELRLYVSDRTEDVLEEVFEALLRDPEPILNLNGKVAMMVHDGRTVVVMQPSANCLTIEKRFGTAGVKMKSLAATCDYVAELVEGKVMTYAI